MASDVQQKLKQFIQNEILQQPDFPLDEETSLLRGGLIDSFAIVDIALFIESTFDIQLSDADLDIENIDTIAAMTARVLQALSQETHAAGQH